MDKQDTKKLKILLEIEKAEDAAKKIQKFWRKYIVKIDFFFKFSIIKFIYFFFITNNLLKDLQVFKYYKDLVVFHNEGSFFFK